MKIIIVILFLYVTLIGCTKEKVDSLLTVEVYDYLTDQPIDSAEILRSRSSDWSWLCTCYNVSTPSKVGFTGPDGKLNGLLNFDGIYILKDKYIPAYKNLYSLTSGDDYHLRFQLFRVGVFNIDPLPSRNYQESVWLATYPILKNGQIPKSYYAGQTGLTPGVDFSSIGYAGMQNRLFVLKRSSTSIPDTLARMDIFLPENTVLPVALHY